MNVAKKATLMLFALAISAWKIAYTYQSIHNLLKTISTANDRLIQVEVPL
jgi:hypothetical protein